MIRIKAVVIAAACAIALPALAQSTTDTAKAVDKAKAEAKAEAKKPVQKQQVAGQVAAPVVTKDSAQAAGSGAAKDAAPYDITRSRWVPKDDRS